MSNAVADDEVELLAEDSLSIRYRLRKCGSTRVLITAIVVLLVIGVLVGAVFLLRVTLTKRATKRLPFEPPASGLCKKTYSILKMACLFLKILLDSLPTGE